jgi:hypothetical protein
MRHVRILGGIVVILCLVAWRVVARPPPPGSIPLFGALGLRTPEVPMRPQETVAESMGLFSAQPETVGGPGPMMPGPAESPAHHPLAHVVAPAEAREAMTPQPPAPGGAGAPGGAELDQSGAAALPPSATVSPASARPPGTPGPGRPVSGWSGPGLPAPGRSARPPQ